MLPAVVYRMCVSGAYIVGSYAKYMVGDDVDPKDFDLLVPPENWQQIFPMVPSDATLNKMGGLRFEVDGVEVDVWQGRLEDYLRNCRTKYGGSVVAVDFVNNRSFSSRQTDMRLKQLRAR